MVELSPAPEERLTVMDIVEQIERVLDRATQDFDGRDEIMSRAAAEIRQLRHTRDGLIDANNRYQKEARDARNLASKKEDHRRINELAMIRYQKEADHFANCMNAISDELNKSRAMNTALIEERDKLAYALQIIAGEIPSTVNTPLGDADIAKAALEELRAGNNVAMAGEDLCDDEGCDHYGTPHVCITVPPRGNLCSNTGLPCLPGCDGKTCAGMHVPLNEWPK